jgi:hypothetical protein
MQNKPILIGFAAAILILVVAAASFSAGLYFGQRGYVANLQYQQQQTGPGQFPPGGAYGQNPQGGQFPPNQYGQSPQGGQLPQGASPQNGPQSGQPPQGANNPPSGPGPAGAPSWPPDLIGRIASITDTSIVLDTPNGAVTVEINADTAYLDQQGAETTPDQLQVGLVVAIFGRPTATSVMILPPPNQQP